MVLRINQELVWCLLIESLVLIVILFSPLIYGSVTIVPLSIVESISFFLLFIFLFKKLLEKEISLVKTSILLAILFIFLVVLQLLSLPKGLLSFLSPATLSLYRFFRINPYSSLTLSLYPEATLNMLLQLLSYLAVFLVALNFNTTENRIRRLLFLIIICGFSYSLFGILMCDLSNLSTQFSTFTNRDHFAAYIEMIVFVCLGYSLTRANPAQRIIFIFMAAVMMLALFLTGSRAGEVCLLLTLILSFLLLKTRRPMKRTVSLAVVLLLFFSLFLGATGLKPLTRRMETLFNPIQAYADRFQLAKDSLYVAQDFPFLGTGLGTFIEIAQKYKTADWQVTYAFCHNEPLQLLVEVGIIGFLLIFLFFLKYFFKVFSLWLKRRNHFVVYITLGLLAGLISAILHSILEFVFHVPANAILFFVLLALTYRIVYLKGSGNSPLIPEIKIILPVYFRISLIGVLLCLLIFGESLIFKRFQAEEIFQRVRRKKIPQASIEAIIEYRKVLKEIDQAITLNPLSSVYVNKKADLLSEIALREDLAEGLTSIGNFQDVNEVLNLAGKAYQQAINLNPTKADYHLRLGWLYSVRGQIDLMRAEFNKALLLDPRNQNTRDYVQPFLK